MSAVNYSHLPQNTSTLLQQASVKPNETDESTDAKVNRLAGALLVALGIVLCMLIITIPFGLAAISKGRSMMDEQRTRETGDIGNSRLKSSTVTSYTADDHAPSPSVTTSTSRPPRPSRTTPVRVSTEPKIASERTIRPDPDRRHILTDNEQLIYAVKGYKNTAALAVGMLNPVAGMMVAAADAKESNKDLRKIDELLERGANIDHQDFWGYTPLIWAAYKGYPEIASHLLAKGANAQITDRKGYNAYTMANYYLKQYRGFYRDNESKPYSEHFDAETQTRMRKHYQQYIDRYQQLVQQLEPCTHNRTMP